VFLDWLADGWLTVIVSLLKLTLIITYCMI